MSRISLDDVRDAAEGTDELFHEFLREDALSVGLYTIPTGEPDPQCPHDEDEVYYVVSGRAEFTHEGDRYPVESGDCIYVERGDEHRFVDVTETLELLVFFAPAEGTLADD